MNIKPVLFIDGEKQVQDRMNQNNYFCNIMNKMLLECACVENGMRE